MMAASGATPAAARTPDIRLPDWNRVNTRILEWDGQGRLTLELEVGALAFPVRDVAARLYWPTGFTCTNSLQATPTIAPGTTWKATFTARTPAAFDGWLEIELTARPEVAPLVAAVEAVATFSPAARTILLEEARGFTAPIPIGRPMPLHLDAAIAAAVPRELVFTPCRPMGTRALFFWTPAAVLVAGADGKTFDRYVQACQTLDDTAALAAIGSLLQETAAATEPLVFKTLEAGETRLPPGTFREALRAAELTLRALADGPAGPANLRQALEKAPPSFSPPFLWANLSTLAQARGDTGLAAAALARALDLNPAWPMLRRWAGESPGGKK